MADTATALVTGPVLLVEQRSGTTRPTDGSEPRHWNMTTARVLVENLGITEVTIPDGLRPPIEGEAVSYVVEVRPRNGGVSTRALRAA
jgi:hypothetical protein